MRLIFYKYILIWFVRLIFILQCDRLLFKKMREKQMSVAYHFLHIHSLTVRTMWEVRLMIESGLLLITYLLFYGMIALTIINVALIIALAILLSKQQ